MAEYPPVIVLGGGDGQAQGRGKIIAIDFLHAGSVRVNFAEVSNNYSIKDEDCYVGVTSTAAPRIISLPTAANAKEGRLIIVKDESGGAAANNITINPNGSETIDGQASIVISKNYGAKAVISDGVSAWYIVGIVAEGGAVGAADPLCQLFAGVVTTSAKLAGAQLIGGGNFDPARFTFTTLYYEVSAFVSNSTVTGTVELRKVSTGTVVATRTFTGAGDLTQNTKSVAFSAPGSAEEYAVYAYVDDASESITIVNARLAAI